MTWNGSIFEGKFYPWIVHTRDNGMAEGTRCEMTSRRRVRKDASRINIHEPYEVEYWTQRFSINEAIEAKNLTLPEA